MELMSSLLFCALVALPQALGDKRDPSKARPELEFLSNNLTIIHQTPQLKKILLNINRPPVMNMVSDLQTVFIDDSCRDCIDCMERAIKSYKSHYHKTHPSPEESYERALRKRNKREAARNTTMPEKTSTKTKMTKSKRKLPKTVTVTKYNLDGDVFALKVKETYTQVNDGKQQNDTQASICQVYNVKKSFPCDTPEGKSFLTVAKRKANKKSKKEKDRFKTVATKAKPHFMAPVFKKREVDNSQ